MEHAIEFKEIYLLLVTKNRNGHKKINKKFDTRNSLEKIFDALM